MATRSRVIGGIVLLLAVGVGVLSWQFSQFGKALRTLPADTAGEVLVSALAPQVLAPSLDVNSQPVLDQYRDHPDHLKRQYLLAVTWLHATNTSFAIAGTPLRGMVLSTTISAVPPQDRVDAWGGAYCVAADSVGVTVLSSGGNGALDCEALRETARQAALMSSDYRLTRAGNVLAAVYKRRDSVGESPSQLRALQLQLARLSHSTRT